MNATPKESVCVIGAGVAGLTAARQLQRSGHQVRVLDKGRGLGGRLATRRIGGARLDHGAQFFTVRGDSFRTTIDAAIADGIVDVWCHGFDGDDGHPRYYCPGGMTSLAKWLAASVVDAGGHIETGVRVERVGSDPAGVGLALDSGDTVTASHLIITSPVPQTLELFDAGGIDLDSEQRRALEAIGYMPTIGLLVSLDGPPNIDPPGGINNPEATFSFIADNFQKGISSEQAATFHLNSQTSRKRWDDDPTALKADLIELAQPWLGSASIVEAQLKTWKYATPVSPYPETLMALKAVGATIVLAGDAFGGPKVEGAFNSGLDAAECISSN